MDRRGFLGYLSGLLAALGLAAPKFGEAIDAADVVIPPLSQKPDEDLTLVGDVIGDEVAGEPVAASGPFVMEERMAGGSFYYDQAVLVWKKKEEGGTRIGLIATGITVEYRQPIHIVDPASPDAVYIAGRTQGTISIDHLAGPKALMEEFTQSVGCVMNARANDLQLEPAGYPSIRYTLRNCVLSSIGRTSEFGSGCMQMQIAEKVQAMFTTFDLDESFYNDRVQRMFDEAIAADEVVLLRLHLATCSEAQLYEYFDAGIISRDTLLREIGRGFA